MDGDLEQKFPKERVIKAKSGLVGIDFAELWNYRELLLFMAWRDILVRYKQTGVGIAWAVIRPLMMMIVFTLIFGKAAKLPSDGLPYPLLTLVALLPWQFFSQSLTQSSNSLVVNANMISKVYFPRLITPGSVILATVVDFLISFILLVVMMAYYKFIPTVAIFTLPLFFLLAFLASLGLSMWLSALNVEYRDVRHAVPFMVQFGLFMSPVGFSSSIIPEKWRLLYSLNPMVGVIDGFRWAILGQKVPLDYRGLILSSLTVLLLLVSGAFYFRKMERTFADVI